MTAATAGTAARFSLQTGGAEDAGPDVLGLWAITGADPPSVSFEPGAALAPEGFSTWRVDLPADPRVADAILSAAEARVAAADAVLATVPAMLVDVGRRWQEARTAPVAFGPAMVAPAPSVPEARLLTTLDELWGAGVPGAYGPVDTLIGVGRAATAEFDAFVARVRRAVLAYARVETREEGQLLAETVVGWSGDARTVVGTGLDSARAARHGRMLTLAMASRAAMLRTIALAARGAVILATFSSGVGAVAAVPAAWRFIHDVLALVRTDQAGGQGEVFGGR